MNNLLNGKDLDPGVVLGSRYGVFNSLIFLFLILNLVVRFCTIFYYPPYNAHIAGFFGFVVACCIVVILFPKYLKAFLLTFGFSFFLYGFGSIDIQSRVFELIVTCVAATLFIINHRAKERHRLNRHLVVLILCYVFLSLFSLLQLPVRQIVKDVLLFGFPDSFFYMFIGPHYGFYFPVSAVIQLVLFVVLASQLSAITVSPSITSVNPVSTHRNPFLYIDMASRDSVPKQDNNVSIELYKSLFVGIFSGAVFSAFIGLLDFYGVISLAWYRFGTTITPGVLHSTFQNRNCFTEFVITLVPFVLLGFTSQIKGAWFRIVLFGSLVICEVALILSGSRAGWGSYPFILFICWFFFYYSREGRFKSFYFGWRDLLKVSVSAPITIVISLLLILYIFMPISDQLRNKFGIKGISGSAKSPRRYLERQAERIKKLDLANRYYTWGQGIHIGREGFLYGMGYQSFSWHTSILTQIPKSYIKKFLGSRKKNHSSPHNVFISIFVSGGIFGVCLWLLIIGYSLTVLIVDLIRNKRLHNLPVIISIISFHIIGLVQSMQDIPMIWLLIFLNLGYAMTIDEGVLPLRVIHVSGIVTKVGVVLVLIGFFVYLNNFESRKIAEKYGLSIYAMAQDRDRYAGFFPHSRRWGYGNYRWSGKRGAIYVPGGDMTEVDFHCRTPGVEKKPVVLSVYHDGNLLDAFSFSKQGSIKRKYNLPETLREKQRLLIDVSRTWIPHNHLGNFDRRELGVGVAVLSTDDQ